MVIIASSRGSIRQLLQIFKSTRSHVSSFRTGGPLGRLVPAHYFYDALWQDFLDEEAGLHDDLDLPDRIGLEKL